MGLECLSESGRPIVNVCPGAINDCAYELQLALPALLDMQRERRLKIDFGVFQVKERLMRPRGFAALLGGEYDLQAVGRSEQHRLRQWFIICQS